MTSSISGASVSLDATCPSGDSAAFSMTFDATASTLTLYTPDGSGGGYVDHYIKE